MTTSIGRDNRERESLPLSTSESDMCPPGPLLTGIKLFTIAASLGWMGALMLAIVGSDWRAALAAATLSVFAVVGGAVLCLHAFLATRQDFYQRGELDGWMRCLHGEPPEVHDPLFRR